MSVIGQNTLTDGPSGTDLHSRDKRDACPTTVRDFLSSLLWDTVKRRCVTNNMIEPSSETVEAEGRNAEHGRDLLVEQAAKLAVYIHDYAGHISQLEVARELARRGHTVTFTYCDRFSTPRGDMETGAALPGLTLRSVSIDAEINKTNYLKRQLQDIQYAGALVRDIRSTRCDVALSCNTPLVPEAALLRFCRRTHLPLIHWWSEVYSRAVHDGLQRKSKVLATLVGGAYQRLEKWLLNRSDGAISVCRGAVDIAKDEWGIRRDISVIPVAAPVHHIRPTGKSNPWSQRHGLADTLNIVYSGTLGIKHRPEFLSQLAAALRSRGDIRVIVISEGPGAEYLRQEKSAENLDNLLLFPFQPFEDYPNVLGTADIQITILDSEAGKYSLPSKCVSQLCSGKPQVAVVPLENDAARMIREADAGLVSQPDDYESFEGNIKALIDNRDQRTEFGQRGRLYVENKLEIGHLVAQYEQIMRRVIRTKPRATAKAS